MKDGDSEQKGMSRRSLLKGAAAVGAMAGLGGLALNLAAPGTAEAITKKLPQKWDETWDVVAIGSGFAGLAAAAEGKDYTEALKKIAEKRGAKMALNSQVT